MKICCFFSALALASAISGAHAATVLFDFNSSILSGTPSNTASVTDGSSQFTATLTTSAGNLGSTVTSGGTSKDWTGTTTTFDTSSFDSFIGEGVSFGDSWKTFISGGSKSANLTLTLSGLVAGATYQIAVTTGCPFEGAGAWNSMTTSNTYESVSAGFGGQTIPVQTPTGYTLTNVVANERGEIVLTVRSTNGSHTATFNSLAISGPNVPEPGTASLGLIGLAGLFIRRRKN